MQDVIKWGGAAGEGAVVSGSREADDGASTRPRFVVRAVMGGGGGFVPVLIESEPWSTSKRTIHHVYFKSHHLHMLG